MATVTIEVDGPHNACLRFRPLQRSIRGRLAWNRCANPEAHRTAAQFNGADIPGQHIEFDTDKLTAAIIEPLHLPEFAPVAAEIKKKMRLPPAREEITGCDRDTYLFWMQRAVNDGLAKVVSGKIPTDYKAEAARRDFVFAPREPSTQDKLTAVLERLADVLERALAKK